MGGQGDALSLKGLRPEGTQVTDQIFEEIFALIDAVSRLTFRAKFNQ